MEKKKRRRWAEYYDLPEIKKVRKAIKEAYSDKLQFVEETHQYFLDGVEYTCVSDIVKKWENNDREAMLENCAKKAQWKKDYKYYGMTKDEIRELWDKNSKEACDFGTLVHGFGESMFYWMIGEDDKILPEYKEQFAGDEPVAKNKHEEAVIQFWNDIPECFVPVLAETKVFNQEGTPYAGTFDILFYYYKGKNDPRNGLLVFDYKGLDINTPILTTNGWKTMGTIQEGDVVYDKDGKETTVLHTSEVHHNPCYRISFNDNTSVIADHEHRWEITFSNSQSRPKVKVMTTEEIVKFMEEHPNRGNILNIPKIYMAKPIGSEKVLPIDPYVLGVWLGDGHSACGMVTNMYDEIFEEIKNRGFEIGPDVSGHGAGKAKSRTIYGLSPLLRKNNLLNNKHVPVIYLTSSYEQKLELLRGLMDTDGYYNKKRKRYVLATTKEYQKDFSIELLSAMGIKATAVKCKKYCNGKVYDGYDVSFYSDDYPFLMRKIDVDKPKTDCRSFKNIMKIEPVDTVPTRCIEVDSPTHTFLFGKEMTVTHNTNKDLSSDYCRDMGKMMKAPFNDLVEESLSHYQLQLSLYSIPIEKLGLKVIGRRVIWLLPDGSYEKIKMNDEVGRLRFALNING